ncbi:MAG: twitching motility protein PilT [Pseudobutyrivibrio ruminis]|nr:twitching motility protein PilT [Pseudobutyrivibrio ruminis]
MVEIISGEKGKGKTKYLLDKVNEDVKKIDGAIVYIDKNTKHMYELDSKIRLINMGDYPIESADEFLGFLSGVLSQNADIQEVFLDSFLTISFINDNDKLSKALDKLDKICSMFDVKFVLSISKNEKELPDDAKGKIIISL